MTQLLQGSKNQYYVNSVKDLIMPYIFQRKFCIDQLPQEASNANSLSCTLFVAPNPAQIEKRRQNRESTPRIRILHTKNLKINTRSLYYFYLL